ncbi:hypothetical protein [Microbacterium kunmingense]|uniref:hypothetical protein n=1 Tax=Microbacterium kunmingense TaxID=2915939 RepID=UPI0020066523|nr:hypothetical protein [Microbacterium kunmingense]
MTDRNGDVTREVDSAIERALDGVGLRAGEGGTTTGLTHLQEVTAVEAGDAGGGADGE